MPRKPRTLQPRFSYHVTTRCNNREFKRVRRDCREVFLYTLQRGLEKYDFKLYALCILSNHVHYLLEPAHPEALPQIMHFLNWYTAMCFNRLLNRTGHFMGETLLRRRRSTRGPATGSEHAALHPR